MVIELMKVTKKYGNNPPVLDNITLNFPEGSSFAITGPSGSGKSTLLNLLGILDFPDSGNVLFDRLASSSMTEAEKVNARNSRIGFVFQTHLLLPQLTVLENVLLPVLPQDAHRKKSAPGRALSLLKETGLAGREDSFPGAMSVGECQRVAVVRALINEPEILLADEPTGSLDYDSAEKLSDLIMELRERYRFTLVAVTHSPDLARRMEKHYKLVNGKIIIG
jgi:ABC-type lipoprotein export system ATPase subunit